MKKILITGKNSYIGNSFKEWVNQWPDKYQVDEVETRDGIWKEADFSSYDSILHVAGIAHIKETKENQSLYYKVNRDLAVDIAKKAKEKGVKQFIFLSSMSVYGLTTGVIDENTPLLPKSAYGKSKLEAENELDKLQDQDFKLAIVRPPMVYGKKSPGNYKRLSNFIKKTPVFPNYSNQRSMIFVKNLSEFLRKIIDYSAEGIFKPQNKEYIDTRNMVFQIADNHKKRVCFVPNLLNLFTFLINRLDVFSKLLGNLTYSKESSELIIDNKEIDYNILSFEESIKEVENG